MPVSFITCSLIRINASRCSGCTARYTPSWSVLGHSCVRVTNVRSVCGLEQRLLQRGARPHSVPTPSSCRIPGRKTDWAAPVGHDRITHSQLLHAQRHFAHLQSKADKAGSLISESTSVLQACVRVHRMTETCTCIAALAKTERTRKLGCFPLARSRTRTRPVWPSFPSATTYSLNTTGRCEAEKVAVPSPNQRAISTKLAGFNEALKPTSRTS